MVTFGETMHAKEGCKCEFYKNCKEADGNILGIHPDIIGLAKDRLWGSKRHQTYNVLVFY